MSTQGVVKETSETFFYVKGVLSVKSLILREGSPLCSTKTDVVENIPSFLVN